MQISDYSVAVLASENVKNFLYILLRSLETYKPRDIYIGNAGIKPSTLVVIGLNQQQNYLHIIDLPYKDYSKFETQSLEYRKVISNRVTFLEEVSNQNGGLPILQLDADTCIVNNDFPDIDNSSDIILTVRNMEAGGIIPQFNYERHEYPNLGVVFWNKPNNCKELWLEWKKLQSEISPHGGQFEQNTFLHLMQMDVFKNRKVQKLPCMVYNCYKVDWLKNNPVILHFKGREGRADDHKRPNSKLLDYFCRRK